MTILFLLLLGAAAYVYRHRFLLPRGDLPAPQAVNVVSDRPGGGVDQALAVRMLRRHLVSTSISNDCLVVSSQGMREGTWRMSAFDRCQNTRLGRWRVDVRSGKVERDSG